MPSAQNSQQSQPATAAHPNPAELREQIKQSILAAQDAAREAVREGAQPGTKTIRITDGQTENVYGGQPTPHITYTTEAGNNQPPDLPPQVKDISIAFFIMCAVIVIGWPIARAFGKRLERRADVPAVNGATTDQLKRIEQAVEAMAIEVERISESQRFVAKLQSAQPASRELKSS